MKNEHPNQCMAMRHARRTSAGGRRFPSRMVLGVIQTLAEPGRPSPCGGGLLICVPFPAHRVFGGVLDTRLCPVTARKVPSLGNVTHSYIAGES